MAGNNNGCAAGEATGRDVDPCAGRGLLENPRGEKVPDFEASATGTGLGTLEVPEYRKIGAGKAGAGEGTLEGPDKGNAKLSGDDTATDGDPGRFPSF